MRQSAADYTLGKREATNGGARVLQLRVLAFANEV